MKYHEVLQLLQSAMQFFNRHGRHEGSMMQIHVPILHPATCLGARLTVMSPIGSVHQEKVRKSG